MSTKTLISVAGLCSALFFDLRNAAAQDSKSLTNKETSVTDSVKQLRDVTITGNKPLIKQEIDRLSYDIQADPDSKGNSVLEMMRKVPMLSLDAEDNIQLKGDSNFKILINGKPSSMMERNAKEILRSMPASTIQKIEVITTPPSKYDAEGLTGIINIITHKKLTNGYNGAVNLYHTMPVGGPGTGASFSVKQGKLGLTAFGGGGVYNSPQVITEVNRISLGKTESSLRQNELRDKDSHSGYLGTELSYEIDSLNLLSAEFNINGSKSTINSARQSFLSDEAGLLQHYRLGNDNRGEGSGLDLALNYQLGAKTNKSRLFTFSYRFYGYNFNDFSQLEITDRLNYALPDYWQTNTGNSAENTFQVDFIQTVKKINIEAGMKAISRRNGSDYQLTSFREISGDFKRDPAKSNVFNNAQDVYAVYNTYQFNLGNWGFKTGLRLEKTVIKADFISIETKISQEHVNLVPALIISKKLKDKGNLDLAYTQRIQRPGIYQLNPFIDRANPNVQTSGNPDLHPVIANTLQLSYSLQKKAFINVSVDFISFNSLINQVADYNPENDLTSITYQNTGKAKMLSSNLSVNYPITLQLSLNMNARLGLARVQGISDGMAISTEGVMYSISLSPAFKLGSGWRLNGNLNIRSKTFSLQRENNAYTSSSLGLSKELIKNKLTFSTALNNPFNKYRDSRVNLTGSGFEQISTAQNYFRSYRFSLNYNFGKLKEAIKKNKRGIKNDDVTN